MTGAWRERRLAETPETTETGSSLPLPQTMTARLEECCWDRSSPSYVTGYVRGAPQRTRASRRRIPKQNLVTLHQYLK